MNKQPDRTNYPWKGGPELKLNRLNMDFTPKLNPSKSAKRFCRGMRKNKAGSSRQQSARQSLPYKIARQPDTPPVDVLVQGRSPGSRISILPAFPA
ncbi:hypothetical protein O206_14355 [Ochrobactrum sp. EGD-AQ16]|nr:hypothetical protein O206_14355 [Ochrobactrum sp. EGD-AQ16]